MMKTYLINYDYDRVVFVSAKSETDAIIYLAEYCNGNNEVFQKAAHSMDNINQLLELYCAFYSEHINIFLEIDESKGWHDNYVDWIGCVE